MKEDGDENSRPINQSGYQNDPPPALAPPAPDRQLVNDAVTNPKERKDGEIFPGELKLTPARLGKGVFGVVKLASLVSGDGKSQEVAAKTIHGADSDLDIANTFREDLRKEFMIHRRCVPHANVVTTIGFLESPVPYVVLELVRGTNLKSLLLNESVTMEQKCIFAKHAADGLTFIHSRGVIHRDIAARNCLVQTTNKSYGLLKISDFSLARDVSKTPVYLDEDSKFPVAWSALESLEKREWSKESDMWSYGVLMYELFEKGGGGCPYNSQIAEMLSVAALKQHLLAGNRLRVKEDMPSDLRQAMNNCWLTETTKRPSANMISTLLEKIIASGQFGEEDSSESDEEEK